MDKRVSARANRAAISRGRGLASATGLADHPERQAGGFVHTGDRRCAGRLTRARRHDRSGARDLVCEPGTGSPVLAAGLAGEALVALVGAPGNVFTRRQTV